MASQGPLSPASASNNTSIGAVAWANVANAETSNNAYATIDLTGDIYGYRLQLVSGGTIMAGDRDPGDFWDSVEAYHSYGATDDDWDRTWTAAEINSSSFGVAQAVVGVAPGPDVISNYLVVTNFGFSIPTGASIDGIIVEVERTTANLGGGTTQGKVDHIRVTVYYSGLFGSGHDAMSFSQTATAQKAISSIMLTDHMVFSERLASSASRIESNPMRKIALSAQFAWKKVFRSTYKLFTIGSSTIGGGDFISSENAVISDWNKYLYTDESDYVLAASWEQEFNMPLGGMVKAIGDITLSNTTGRFTPDFLGGHSELFTAVDQPRRPLIINAGFHYNDVDNLEPQVVAVTTKSARVNLRDKVVDFSFSDFMEFLQNKYVDQTAMYTGIRSDLLIENVLLGLGFATAQYRLDTGINVIPFAYLPAGSKFGDIINEIVQAENAHMYQDVNGMIRFENRQHWNTAPYTYVTRDITTGMVIDASSPSDDHIINAVEINSTPYTKRASALIYTAPTAFQLDIGSTDIFINFDNPILSTLAPVFTVNSAVDGSGTNLTASVSITKSYVFAQSAKYTFSNGSGQTGYITSMTINGRQAAPTDTPIYFRQTDGSSLTAYDERAITINNNYIQTLDWARSYAQLILNDFSEPESLQTIKIRAIPGLKISDLISWQGAHWRIYGVKTNLDPGIGFVQELNILKHEIITYFRIGISLIGGADTIAP